MDKHDYNPEKDYGIAQDIAEDEISVGYRIQNEFLNYQSEICLDKQNLISNVIKLQEESRIDLSNALELFFAIATIDLPTFSDKEDSEGYHRIAQEIDFWSDLADICEKTEDLINLSQLPSLPAMLYYEDLDGDYVKFFFYENKNTDQCVFVTSEKLHSKHIATEWVKNNQKWHNFSNEQIKKFKEQINKSKLPITCEEDAPFN